MSKQIWKPGNMLYPLPAVMVSVADKAGNSNIITLAWVGTVCSDPAMVSISVRKERFSHHMLKETGEFVINLTTEKLVRAMDACGVKSGRDTDKFKEMGLTAAAASTVKAPLIAESPVNIECKVRQVLELGSHDMFVAEVTAVQADEAFMDDKNRFCLDKAGLIAYSHGTYYSLGKALGTFGYSVRRKKGGKEQ